jgi:O-acetyl-ADP-ribose deacetylase (regulator of RNase III)
MDFEVTETFTLKVRQASILDVGAKYIINPTNTYLRLSTSEGHVSTLLNKEAGPSLQKELAEQAAENNNHVREGRIMITGSYDLLDKYGIHSIIHTVTKNPGENFEHLRFAVGQCLALAAGFFWKPMAFPLIANNNRVSVKEFIDVLIDECNDNKPYGVTGVEIFLAIPDETKFNEAIAYLQSKKG